MFSNQYSEASEPPLNCVYDHRKKRVVLPSTLYCYRRHSVYWCIFERKVIRLKLQYWTCQKAPKVFNFFWEGRNVGSDVRDSGHSALQTWRGPSQHDHNRDQTLQSCGTCDRRPGSEWYKPYTWSPTSHACYRFNSITVVVVFNGPSSARPNYGA